jgi:2-oxoglutarate/2-oxoacid ferredoxin oxidoreductase subunit beta
MMSVRQYIRERFFPHLWCPGCGHGTVLNNLVRAVEELGLKKNDIVMVSGIGCSSRIAGYLDFHTLHTLHGRALAFATGVKLSRPELNVIVPMGDGDALAIGGNHFIHAARRNINITAIVMNNRIYGMTGGQYSPLSGEAIKATTAPFGNIDPDFDVVNLATAAGASYVARTTTYHVQEIQKRIAEAISHPGFAVVEVMSQCPTYFGRKNKQGDAVEMLGRFKEADRPRGRQTDRGGQNARGVFSLTASGPSIARSMTRSFNPPWPATGPPPDRRASLVRATDRTTIMNQRYRLVFSGSGGQGVITAAILLAEAAVLHEKRNAVQTQVYGAAARGGATRSDVIISDAPINYPKVNQSNFLVCLTQEAYAKYSPIVRPGGLLVTDSRFVTTHRKVDAVQHELPMYQRSWTRSASPLSSISAFWAPSSA